jgi:putative ABC transport system permease protein
MPRLPLTALLVSLWPLVWREWRHHPWRHGVAMLAVALGVALAWSVHLINASALSEFSQAVRSANGQPDAVLRGPREGFDDTVFDAIAGAAGVALASPVVEIDTYAAGPDGTRVALRVLGIDMLAAASIAPELMPRPAAGIDRLAGLDPERAFVNAAARDKLRLRDDGGEIALQSGPRWQRLRVSGDIAAGGAPLVVIDIAGAQRHFGMLGRLSRIDLKLQPGVQVESLAPLLPAGVRPAPVDEAEQRVSNLSRAYRVNLTVLALVALFVGVFLVYSVTSLSIAQRTPQFALLGVLGMTAPERRALVLVECAALGAAGSALGLLLGIGMAQAALRWLAGDLGGGFFPGIAPALRIDGLGALAFGLLGTAGALVGGWVPASRASALQPALALKGLGAPDAHGPKAWPGLLLLAAGVLLALAPPIGGLSIAAYAAVGALMFGGVALVPWAVHGLLAAVAQPRGALTLLALERARFQRHTATAAVAGVVASLALSVALTVMVTSFRAGVSQWLDGVLPADLYARTAGSSAAGDQAWIDTSFVSVVAALPGVAQVKAARARALAWAPARPSVTLFARELGTDGDVLPLVGPALAARPGETGVFVSEAMVALYGATPGSTIVLPITGLSGRPPTVRVRGVWRDYARQFGTVAIALADYRRLTGDTRINDLAIWLAPGTPMAQVQAALRAAAPDPAMLEFVATTELRKISLRIFDRSFAVTYYLQAVAIAIGLVGIAASLSAQVLARRKEFGLLAHLGLTRRQIIAVVAGEGAAWLAAGALVGLALGLAISVVLVKVVNPQSFHWSMDLVLPHARLALLCAAVMAAGIGTAAFSARAAASRSAVLSVKEDW